MRAHEFDDLTKALAMGASRRQALRRLGGGLAAAALAAVLPGRVALGQRTCIQESEPCNPGDRCCQGLICTSQSGESLCQRCVEIGQPCKSGDRCCASDQATAACRDGTCQLQSCGPGQVPCSYPSGTPECIFTAGGPYHCDGNGCRSFNCGGCGPQFTCPYGSRCCEGRCQPITGCVHCGCCTRKATAACVCMTEEEFQARDPSKCLASFQQCAGLGDECLKTADCCGGGQGINCSQFTGVCRREVERCGLGGIPCGQGGEVQHCCQGYLCHNGVCERAPEKKCPQGGPNACQSGETCCDGECVDTSSDRGHCGGCRMACPPFRVCVGGQCQCPAGTQPCGPFCRATC